MKGKMPVQEVTEILDKVGATVEDLAYFLRDDYRGKRGANPASWAHVLTSVRNWSVDPKLARDISVRRMFAEGEARERERQARMAEEQAECERVASIPVAPDEAIAATVPEIQKAPYTYRGYLLDVPDAIKRRLRRIGAAVSPAEVLNQVRQFRPCKECGDEGLVGYTLDRSRTFCGCISGEELRLEDPGKPAREIEHTHASLKNKLVAAAYANNCPFVGDSIDSSSVAEEDGVLVIDVAPLWRVALGPKGQPTADLLRCVEVVTGKRAVRLAWARPKDEARPQDPDRWTGEEATKRPPITAADFAPYLAARATA